MWWCNSLVFVDSSIILLRKDLPGGTTRQACCKCLIKDSSSRLVHDFFIRQDRINACRRTNLSRGSLISKAVVSKSIPRKTRTVTSPSTLSFAIGTPKYLHSLQLALMPQHILETLGPQTASNHPDSARPNSIVTHYPQ